MEDRESSKLEAEPGQSDSEGKSLLAADSGKAELIRTSASHQVLTLIGFSFLCFEFIFIVLYFDRFWFSIDLCQFGIAAVVFSVLLAHLLLTVLESIVVCRMFFFWRKGAPLIVYRNWLSLSPDRICFGVRILRLDVIDQLEQSWFGNLIFKSRLLCGQDALQPDLILKIPFSAASYESQEKLLAQVKACKPNITLDKRLESGRNPALSKGSAITQLFTALIMTLLLFDVGFSSFYYLELLKNYYLAQTAVLLNKNEEAARAFQKAEYLRMHPLAFSWVSSKFLHKTTASAGLWEARAKYLALKGDLDEAIKSNERAVEDAPLNLRHRLFQTRLLVERNNSGAAEKQLEQVLKDHKHSLLPRLYLLAIARDQNDKAKIQEIYKEQMDPCYEDTFGNEPHWPPGGNRHFIELFYSDDILFLLDRFLNSNYQPPAYEENPEKQ